MIRLSIKGTRSQTDAALHAHGIHVATFVDEYRNANSGTCFWDVSESHRDTVVRWYCENPRDCVEDVGYPPGTLLHHN